MLRIGRLISSRCLRDSHGKGGDLVAVANGEAGGREAEELLEPSAESLAPLPRSCLIACAPPHPLEVPIRQAAATANAWPAWWLPPANRAELGLRHG